MKTNEAKLPNSLRMNTTSSTLARQTSNQDFAAKLRQGASQGTRFASHVFDTVAPAVPGGAVVSAALNDATNSLASSQESVFAPQFGGAQQGFAPLPATPGNMLTSVASLQQNMMSQNVAMLGLQNSMQQESQKYTAWSNILRMKYETAKNAVSNMR